MIISEGSPLNITSETVHYLDRRVDHNLKQITLFEISFLIHGLGKCEGVGEDSGYEMISKTFKWDHAFA